MPLAEEVEVAPAVEEEEAKQDDSDDLYFIKNFSI